MGAMIDGRWDPTDNAIFDDDDNFARPASSVRHQVTARGRFPAEPGRYHLYVSEGCPWAHRVRLVRALLKLEDIVSVSTVTRTMSMSDGWSFDEVGAHRDHLFGLRSLHEVYAKTAVGYTGRVTVPVLVDKVTRQLVNNESADIIRMMNEAFVPLRPRAGEPRQDDLYPPQHRPEIDALNARIYEDLNNGVYRAGFALSQRAHDRAVDDVFGALDFLEERLADRRYLCGDALTEADVRLFPTLLRFDAAYRPVFGCDRRALAELPNLMAYTRDLCGLPGVAATILPLAVYRRGYAAIPFAWGVRHGLGPIEDPELFDPPRRREAPSLRHHDHRA